MLRGGTDFLGDFELAEFEGRQAVVEIHISLGEKVNGLKMGRKDFNNYLENHFVL